MPKFLSLGRIKSAISHLSNYDSRSVIHPFVLASNMITTGADGSTRVTAANPNAVGTDAYLDNFFSPKLLGLPPKAARECLRPIFREMGNPLPPDDPSRDYIMHQETRIWANIYSQTVHTALRNRGLITADGNSIRLEAGYQADFEATLANTFNFEDFLVWLFAFQDIPDTVNNWTQLWSHFKAAYLHGNEVPPEYRGRFYIHDPELPWPTDFVNQKPSFIDYQRALIPSAFAEPILPENWVGIAAELSRLVKEEYDGIPDSSVDEITRTVSAGLSATKRAFLIGDPGTGKTKFTGLIEQAFDKILENDRLFVIRAEITDKTSETTLLGFVGIDGKWVDGILTQERSGRRLLRPIKAIPAAEPVDIRERDQVNLIILNEANRQDAESLLARLQLSLDSTSKDPLSSDHIVPLGSSGDFRLSPYSYVVMTGNSPRDDTGRVEQSRPFQRRVILVTLPNPLSAALETDTHDDFKARILKLWGRCASESLMTSHQIEVFRQQLDDAGNAATLGMLKVVLKLVQQHGAGLSYGLLRKVLVLAANEMALGNATLGRSLDAASVSGLGAILSAAKAAEGVSIRQRLIDPAAGIAGVFPLLCEWAKQSLSDPGEIGIVAPYF
jgi:hypothetical protein